MAESIQSIRRRYEAASEDMLPSFIEAWESDPRAGVRAIVAGARKRLSAIAAEHERIRELRDFEREAAGDYLTGGYLCGIDEAGRGPLAGPVAAGAVILPPEEEICGINDSKKLTPAKREKLYEEITSKAISWAVGLVSPARIDEINILQATYEAMRRAESELLPQPEVLIVDAVRIPGLHLPQVPVIRGDAKCLSVGAASILAKVTRDRIMEEYDRLYPEYGFAENKGYGSAAHIAALRKYGPCPIHRRSFIGHFIDPETPVCNRSTRSVGTMQENAAAEYLTARGVRILAHSYRGRRGEIDLVGCDQDGTLLFIEVKYRSSARYGDPSEAVTAEKQETICRVCDEYRREHGIPDTRKQRFDIVAVDMAGIRWIRNAFPYRAVRRG